MHCNKHQVMNENPLSHVFLFQFLLHLLVCSDVGLNVSHEQRVTPTRNPVNPGRKAGSAKRLAPGAWRFALCALRLAPGVWRLASRAWCLAPAAWRLALGAWGFAL